MSQAIRMFGTEGIYFVTARTVQGRLLLRPSSLLNEVLGGILARASRKYRVAIRGYVFMSNHLHLLVRAPGNVLSRFMQFLLANIARKVGRIHEWRGPFWHSRFSCEPVLDPEAELNRLRYILAHGVKEGLVAHPADWPGLSCLEDLNAERPRRFPFFNWDWRWSSRALQGVGPWDQRLVEEEELVLEPITAWRACDSDARRLLTQALTDRLARELRESSRRGKVAGAARVLREEPHRPTEIDRRPHPVCHASSRLVREQFLELYRDFRRRYAAASRAFRQGDLGVQFPPGSFLPPAVRARGEEASAAADSVAPALLVG